MKKLLLMLLATLSASSFASDNWENTSALTWKNGDGTLCWRDAGWTPATAAKDCDGWLAPKAAKPAAKPAVGVSQNKITLQADTLFDFDKSIVKPEGQVVLSKLAEKIKSIKTEVIVVVGNTDSIGTDDYNLALGQRRASAVKAYLISKGAPSDKIYIESKGKSNPVASNATAEGRAKNRRVDIEVVGK